MNVRCLQFIESYKDAILGLIKKTNQIRDLTLELTGNSAICLSVERGRDADDGVGDAGTLNGGAYFTSGDQCVFDRGSAGCVLQERV